MRRGGGAERVWGREWGQGRGRFWPSGVTGFDPARGQQPGRKRGPTFGPRKRSAKEDEKRVNGTVR